MSNSIKILLLCLLSFLLLPNHATAIADKQQGLNKQQVEQAQSTKTQKTLKKTKVEKRLKKIARLSLLFGCLSILISPLGVVGLVLSIMAKTILKDYKWDAAKKQREQANTGNVLSIIGFILPGLVIISLFIWAARTGFF